MPPAHEQRRSSRIDCRIPLRIAVATATLDGVLLDASRTGARVRLAGAALGVYRLAPLALVARRVAEVLGESFPGVLLPDRLGSLVTKRLRPVRIGQRDPALADVDLGCTLDPALSDLEASMLGLALPMLRGDGTEDSARVTPQAVRVRPAPATVAPPPRPPAPPAPPLGVAPAAPPAPRARSENAPAAAAASAGTASLGIGSLRLSRWRAYVHPTGERRLPPFLAAAESVSAQGVQLRVMDRAALQLEGGRDVASTILSLDGSYGTDVALKLVDGPTHLWTGPARIAEVEVPADAPQQVSLWLTFGRALRPAELRALGLA